MAFPTLLESSFSSRRCRANAGGVYRLDLATILSDSEAEGAEAKLASLSGQGLPRIRSNSTVCSTEASPTPPTPQLKMLSTGSSTSSGRTVLLFDWDDTLLCTSALLQHLGQPLPAVLDSLLRRTSQAVKTLLELAIRMGHTYIVTNAAPGWVEYSAAVWLPEVLPLLKQVQIISARGSYQHLYPNDASKWKLETFLDVCQDLEHPVANLVVIGDADHEMEAARAMEDQRMVRLIKTVRFHSQPTVKEHLRQLEIIAARLERIVQKSCNLRVVLEKKGVEARPGPNVAQLFSK